MNYNISFKINFQEMMKIPSKLENKLRKAHQLIISERYIHQIDLQITVVTVIRCTFKNTVCD